MQWLHDPSGVAIEVPGVGRLPTHMEQSPPALPVGVVLPVTLQSTAEHLDRIPAVQPGQVRGLTDDVLFQGDRPQAQGGDGY